MRPLYDWPRDIVPAKAMIQFVTTVEEGRVSRATYETSAAVPGGRAQLMMEFDYTRQAPPPMEMYSWLCSKLKGNIFRVPVPPTAQIARDADLGLPDHAYSKGIPFDGGAYFASGVGFAFDPTVDTAGTALEGETEIAIDETRWPGLIRYGKWIGIGFGCYHVEEAIRDGSIVTATVNPPLLRDIAAGEFVSLRPSLICQAPNDISSFVGMYEPGDLVKPGSLTMTQVRDERFL